jgi:hypothetical protein
MSEMRQTGARTALGTEVVPSEIATLESRNAVIEAFVKFLNEGRCEQCLTLFPAVGQGTVHDEPSAGGQKLSEVPTAKGSYSASMSNDRSIDQSLFDEYFLIPLAERPIVGSNDWFRWQEEFQQRHPDEVSRLTQPLAERARQVLWNRRGNRGRTVAHAAKLVI